MRAYRLVIDLRGPSFADRVEVYDSDRERLRPTTVGGVADPYTFERYGDDDDYVEFRSDYVVARTLSIVDVPLEQGRMIKNATTGEERR